MYSLHIALGSIRTMLYSLLCVDCIPCPHIYLSFLPLCLVLFVPLHSFSFILYILCMILNFIYKSRHHKQNICISESGLLLLNMISLSYIHFFYINSITSSSLAWTWSPDAPASASGCRLLGLQVSCVFSLGSQFPLPT